MFCIAFALMYFIHPKTPKVITILVISLINSLFQKAIHDKTDHYAIRINGVGHGITKAGGVMRNKADLLRSYFERDAFFHIFIRN